MNPLAAPLLAQSDSAKLGAGAVSLVVLLLMGVATALLAWNMNGRLKKLPSSFTAPQGTDGPRSADAGQTGSPDTEDQDVAPSQASTGSKGGVTNGHRRGTA